MNKRLEHFLPEAVPHKSIGEECGVFGLLDPSVENLGQYLYYGLYALQHRGQESCGMACFDHDQLRLHKDMGLVNQVFTPDVLDKMSGQLGIGHTRYSTTGESCLDNAQPVVVRTRLGALTLAHNGNLLDPEAMADFLKSHGTHSYANSDSHLLAQVIRHHLQTMDGAPLSEVIRHSLTGIRGAYSLVMANGDTLIAARDPHGLRPLCLGELASGGLVVASETCALDIVGARFVRDIAPGEIFLARLDGRRESVFLEAEARERFCFFELVYFARPDSMIHSRSVYQYRMALGKRLAQISPEVEADMVIPVPDSGNVAAVGYSHESGLPYMEGLIKNRYVGRTFIHPTPALRERSIQLKLNPLNDVLRGKRVVVVDDSVVRGNTSKKLVKMLRECGVREVHLRISSAPVKHPCYYGIDMSTPDQLIANKMTPQEMCRWLEADSLVYLDVEDMRQVGGQENFCMACFDARYPAGVPRQSSEAAGLETRGGSVL